MQVDPTLDRIREIRHRISQQCEHDPKKLVEYYLQIQANYTNRLLEQDQQKAPELPSAPAG